MRSKFDEQLALLNRDLTKMGSLCEEALALAAKALANADGQTADKIAPIDSEIDQMERTIESLCLKLLLQQQPVARDLRQISAALKMITDMERIGDQAEDIAEIASTAKKKMLKKSKHIQRMAAATIDMVNKSVEAFIKKDLLVAEEVSHNDDVVDALFEEIVNDLVDIIKKDEGTSEVLDMTLWLQIVLKESATMRLISPNGCSSLLQGEHKDYNSVFGFPILADYSLYIKSGNRLFFLCGNIKSDIIMLRSGMYARSKC